MDFGLLPEVEVNLSKLFQGLLHGYNPLARSLAHMVIVAVIDAYIIAFLLSVTHRRLF